MSDIRRVTGGEAGLGGVAADKNVRAPGENENHVSG
jgi:hypothetical protein